MAKFVRSQAEQVIETPLGVVPECQTMGGERYVILLTSRSRLLFLPRSANPAKRLSISLHHPPL